MAYKFQLGAAIMSGALAQEGKFEIKSDINESLLYQIDRAGVVSGSKALHNVGAATFGSTLAVSGNIDTDGDMTAATITMAGFSVDADGDTALKSLAVDNSSTIGCDADTDIMTLANQSLALANDVDFNVAKAGGLQLGGSAVTSTAAELNKLDGAGADVTAAKLTTLSALTDAEIGFIDGSGDAVVASKVVVADSNKDVRTLRSLTGSTDAVFANFRASDSFISKVGTKTVSISAAAAGSSLGALTLSGTLSSSAGSTIVGSSVFVGAMNISGALEASNAIINMPNVGAASLDAADFFVSRDSTSGDLQVRTRTNVVSDLAGTGLGAASGVLSLDLNELSAAAVDVAADSIAIIDANDSNNSKKESIADLATAMAGAGITATNGVLSTDAAVSSAGVGDANATLAEGLNYGTATFTADRTWTLPASPSSNDIVRVKAPASLGGFDLIIAVDGGGSHLIDGQANIRLESNGGAVTMQYVGSDTWLIY
tara:strand:+ start:339 stop:1799 length:1461 start_codon:yes stop_codon:yes gene_type:complete